MSNLTEQFFKAYNANDMQRVRQYVTSDIVYIEMEVKTRFVLLSVGSRVIMCLFAVGHYFERAS